MRVIKVLIYIFKVRYIQCRACRRWTTISTSIVRSNWGRATTEWCLKATTYRKTGSSLSSSWRRRCSTRFQNTRGRFRWWPSSPRLTTPTSWDTTATRRTKSDSSSSSSSAQGVRSNSSSTRRCPNSKSSPSSNSSSMRWPISTNSVILPLFRKTT